MATRSVDGLAGSGGAHDAGGGGGGGGDIAVDVAGDIAGDVAGTIGGAALLRRIGGGPQFGVGRGSP